MIAGHATQEGTSRLVAHFPRQQGASFYQWAQGLNISGLGLGTYLGGMDDSTDRAYTEAAIAALRGGINFLDTAINYRHQRSERSIGAALAELTGAGEVRRDEVVVCTKAGFLVPHAVSKDVLRAVVEGLVAFGQPDGLGSCSRRLINMAHSSARAGGLQTALGNIRPWDPASGSLATPDCIQQQPPTRFPADLGSARGPRQIKGGEAT